MVVIVDTDALLALFNPEDSLARLADTVAEKLAQTGAEFVILPTTLAEFALVASSRVGVTRTRAALEQIRAMCYRMVVVDLALTDEAMNWYKKQTSKEESLFDCFVMAAVGKIGAECVFSFDKGYKKNGLVLAGDYV
jgi:predicted nucleic acid-binding protein